MKMTNMSISHAETCDVTSADLTYGPCPVCGKEAEYSEQLDTCDKCGKESSDLSHVGRDGYDFLCEACV